MLVIVPTRFVSFLAAATGAAALLAGCGSGDGDSAGATATEAATTATEGATTSVTGAAGGVPSDADAPAGREVFASAGCGDCHTLAAADATGNVGPNLDELKPDFDEVVSQVTSGGGGMPAFGDSLSEQQIRNVAAFVVQSTSQGGAGSATTDDGATGGATTDEGETSGGDDDEDDGDDGGEDGGGDNGGNDDAGGY